MRFFTLTLTKWGGYNFLPNSILLLGLPQSHETSNTESREAPPHLFRIAANATCLVHHHPAQPEKPTGLSWTPGH